MSTEKAVRRLVIVESPAKAKTIQGYLGRGYEVDSSVGHIRDLPKGAAEIPAKFKGLPWANMGIDVDHDFTPIYVVSAAKKSKVAELKAKLANADELLLATDEDREGEAIAWHLIEVLKPKIPYKRMVFHEITPEAIQRASEQTRDLNLRLVDAQETRRLLDRIYGYEISPVLWKKVMQGLSAGRVQSVAIRLIVDRERARIAHTSAGYWDLEATVNPGTFKARLVSVEGQRVATGNDFDAQGQLTKSGVVVLDESAAGALAKALAEAELVVNSVDRRPGTRKPAAPFMTSTLQREASNKLRWGAQRTMRVAQGLYERGYITYMRTDSTTLSQAAINAARTQAGQLYGSDHVSPAPRRYERKVKNAQEAHEAIRPSGDSFRTPAEVAGELVGDDFALYDLIWKRTVASQMADAKVATTTIKLGATAADGRTVEFAASGTVITFPGFLAAYEEGDDEDSSDSSDAKKDVRLPALAQGDTATLAGISVDEHATKPPARYTEASLVKSLEERGIGRPSTYAATMGVLVDRGYVNKKGTALVPTWLAFAVVRLLEVHFSSLVDYDFTATMEEVLDEIANGDNARLEVLSNFYSGGDGLAGHDFPGVKKLAEGLGEIDAREISAFPIRDSDIILRVGRYGPYLDRGGERANIPADLAPDELTAAVAQELMAAPSGDRELGVDPDSGNLIVARSGRYGPYVTEVLPEPESDGEEKPKKRAKAKDKPRTASLFKDMSLDTVSLEEALRLLSLPRIVGKHPDDGNDIVARNGRYGPYITWNKDSRSLPDEPSLFTIDQAGALALLAQPKQRGRQAAAPGKEIGEDPNSKQMITLKDGRFGPYVTDGETNASLRRADDPEMITLERAVELLAERRAAGPAKKRAKKAVKKTAKRAPKKATKKIAKKAAKKATA